MVRWALACLVACGQVPPNEPITPNDDAREFYAEIKRLQQVRASAGDKCTVDYALARTWAAGGQWTNAYDALDKVAGLKLGLDPSNDSIFNKLHATKEYEELLKRIEADSPAILHSKDAFTIGEPDLVPEGICYDSQLDRFFLGSTAKRKIVSCSMKGECKTLVPEGRDGLGAVLGLKVDPRDRTLWAVSNSETESGVYQFHAGSGKFIRKYSVPAKGHSFNDLVIDKRGNVFVTDSAEGKIYLISGGQMRVFIPDLTIESANGIALFKDKLYVAGFPDGITVVDVGSRNYAPMKHPPDLCLATIDGMYYSQGSLIAVQNGVMTHRLIRMRLTDDGDGIATLEVLERGNPLFDGGPTSAAMVRKSIYYVANPQLDKPSGHPLHVLRLDLN